MSGDKSIPWWEEEISRLKVEIKLLEFRLARATYGPALKRIMERLTVVQSELDNAQRAADKHAHAGNGGTAPSRPQVFTCSLDYRSVTIRETSYKLTPRQAHIIQILHEAHEGGNPEISIGHILERIETPNSRWQDSFKTNLGAKKALIRTGSRKGTLRLNL
jgi:hypothetical protein